MTGDMVSGWKWNGQKGWFASHWNQLIQPMIEGGFQWASFIIYLI